jgi:hypothetical protein
MTATPSCARCRDGITHTVAHGTPGAYRRCGCRCEVCRYANAVEKRAWRATHPGRNAEQCRRYRERKAATRSGRKNCERCGIDYLRTRRAPRLDICVDCYDTERDIA